MSRYEDNEHSHLSAYDGVDGGQDTQWHCIVVWPASMMNFSRFGREDIGIEIRGADIGIWQGWIPVMQLHGSGQTGSWRF